VTTSDSVGSNTSVSLGNGNYAVTAGSNDNITLGNGNDTVTAGTNDAITTGNGNESISAGTNATVTTGNGNDTVTVGIDSTVKTGNGNDTITAGADSSVTAGNGTDNVTVGANSSITAGNGSGNLTAGADSTITVGNGSHVITMGSSDSASVGSGSDTFIFAGALALAAPNALTVNEDGTIGLPLGVTQSADGFGTDTIAGFNTSTDKLEFTTSQFANSAAVMADASQVGGSTVINAGASNSIVLQNVNVSQLKASDFIFVNGSSSTIGAVSITISGIPTGVSFPTMPDR
jgi:hypothetical protein